LVADFEGLKDVSAFKARAAALGRDKGVLEAIKRDREDDERERRVLDLVWSAEGRLNIPQQRESALLDLRQKWQQRPCRKVAAAKRQRYTVSHKRIDETSRVAREQDVSIRRPRFAEYQRRSADRSGQRPPISGPLPEARILLKHIAQGGRRCLCHRGNTRKADGR